MIAQNIIDRDFVGLTQALDYQQSAPIGWLFAQRLLWLLTEDVHIGLRIVPLLAGLVALGVVAWIAYRHLAASEAVFVVTAMALLPTHIYYAGEVKQYANDIAAAALITALVWPWLALRASPLTARRALTLGMVGLLLIPLSHPVAFALGGAGAALGLRALEQRDWPAICWLAVAAAAWLGLFTLLYVALYAHEEVVSSMRDFWTDRFAPFPPRSARELFWYYEAPIELGSAAFFEGRFFQNSFRTAEVLVLFVLMLGFARLAVEAWPRAVLLATPVLAAFVASAFEFYPFEGRFLLFAAPAVMIACAMGITWLLVRSTLPLPIVALVPALILLVPLSLTVFEFADTRLKPFDAPDSLRAIEAAAARYREGDALYVTLIGEFRVMRPRLGLADAPVQLIRGTEAHMIADFEKLSRFPRALIVHGNDPLANRRNRPVDTARLDSMIWKLQQVGAESIDIITFREAYLLDVTFRTWPKGQLRRFPKPEGDVPSYSTVVLRPDEILPD